MRKIKLKFLNPVNAGAAGMMVVAGFATLAFIAKRKKAKKKARGNLPPTTGPDGEGSVWGDLPAPGSTKGYAPPANFDYGGYEAWVSPDCNTVVEGSRFWADVTVPLDEMDVVLSTKENALARGARWYIEWAKAAGYTDPKEMVDDMLRILAPLCADAPVSAWSNALYSWYNSAVEKAVEYIDTGDVGMA